MKIKLATSEIIHFIGIGVVGNDCENITESIEERLGNVTYVEKKPEYYLAQPIENFWKNTTDVTLQHDQD